MSDVRVRQQLAGPLYAQVADLLRGRIEDLEWRPDIPMPNEALLAKEMGVSIGTMRKALEALESQRYITRRQGRGTFVVDTSFEAELDRFETIYRADLTRGAEIYATRCGRRAAAGAEQAVLALGSGSEIFEIVRARRKSGAYASSERIVVPASTLDGLEQIEDLSDPLLFSIYRRDFHVVVASVCESILPCNASPELARQLGIETGQAVLRIERIAKAGGGEPIEWSVRHVHIVQTPLADAARESDEAMRGRPCRTEAAEC